jgi:hypothetical protein
VIDHVVDAWFVLVVEHHPVWVQVSEHAANAEVVAEFEMSFGSAAPHIEDVVRNDVRNVELGVVIRDCFCLIA